MKKTLHFLFLVLPTIVFAQQKYDVYFDFNKEVPSQKSAIDFQKWIVSNPNAEISKLYGYCDSVDDNSYNKELSAKRINSIIETLKENNIKLAQNLDIKPFGKDFKRSKKQEENRKVTIFYKTNPKPKNNNSSEEIPANVNLKSKIATEKATLASKFKNAKKGDLIPIENIYFHLDSDKIVEDSKPLLAELYTILAKNPKLKIQIQGHICCNPDPKDLKLSNRRAQIIYAYLLEKEILLYRLSYKGFGSSKPVYKIPEKNAEERLANRRVEILIVEN